MWRTLVLLVAISGAAFAEADVDDGSTKGAVPIPDDTYAPEITIDHRDTTVTLAELPSIGATWKKRGRVPYKGVVPVALNHASFHVNLTFVSSEVGPSGYPGALKRFPLVSSDDGGPWSSSFPGLADKGGPRGPILAAIRVLPSTNGDSSKARPETERRQVVVYVPKGKRVILVATKLLTEKTWTPLLRVDTPNATRIDVMDPGWH
jgi:hypothetical protein